MNLRKRLERLERWARDKSRLTARTCGHPRFQLIIMYPADTPLPLPPDPFGLPVCREGEELPLRKCAECDRWRAERRRPGNSDIEFIVFNMLPAREPLPEEPR